MPIAYAVLTDEGIFSRGAVSGAPGKLLQRVAGQFVGLNRFEMEYLKMQVIQLFIQMIVHHRNLMHTGQRQGVEVDRF